MIHIIDITDIHVNDQADFEELVWFAGNDGDPVLVTEDQRMDVIGYVGCSGRYVVGHTLPIPLFEQDGYLYDSSIGSHQIVSPFKLKFDDYLASPL